MFLSDRSLTVLWKQAKATEQGQVDEEKGNSLLLQVLRSEASFAGCNVVAGQQARPTVRKDQVGLVGY